MHANVITPVFKKINIFYVSRLYPWIKKISYLFHNYKK